MQLRKAEKLFVTVLALAILPSTGFAQQSDSDEVIEEIVVTGTGVERTEFETPQSVTQYSEEDVRLFTSSSQADLLTQLPGDSEEGGGGEVATNVYHRALPSGGQLSFTPLLYDGIPTFTTFGLNSSAFDVFYRNDLGIERAEFVSGGVSNLFGPGSVAGIVNYISKTGGPENAGTVQVEAAEEGRFRSDYFFSGPLGGDDSDTFYALSGYYRFDEGPLKSGLDTQGFQLRGNLKREFSDGSGSITVYGQAIDDSVQFFLPLPLDGVSRERVAGNDGQEVFTMNTVDAIGLSYATPDGTFSTPIADGVLTKGTSIAAVLDKDLTSDWTLNAKLRYAQYDHQFNLFLDGDGLGPNTPETQAEYLANRGVTDPGVAGSALFTYVETGQALAASDLLFGNRTLDRWRDAKDFSAELSVGRNLSLGDAEHTITIGGFFANSQADDLNYITTYLGDFRNAPKLVDVTFVGYEEDATGAIVASADPTAQFQWTQNGLAKANGMVGNRDRSARRTAFYVADQIEKDRWSFDVGLRVERLDGDVKQFNTTTFTMGTDPLLSNNIEQVSYMDGSLLTGTVSTTEWALSAGTLYRLNDTVNLFSNFSRGYFFPQVRSVPFSEVPGQEGELASYEGETIDALEIGAKLQTDNFDGYVTVFYTTLDDRRNVDFENDGSGNVVEVVNLQSTEALGIEASGTYHLNEMWALHANVTLRDSEFTKSENPEVLGKELRRQPLEMINLGARFNYNNFDAALMYNFHGDNYANDSNSVKLDSYNLVRLEAGYTFEFDDGQTLRVSGNIFNLTDDQGISEGSPRQGNAQSGAPAQFFVGRPILPRRMMLRVTYDF